MADIFISYAREDAGVASQLAHALESAGFSVWWDAQIPGGSRYLKETEAELKAARAVIVVWTKHSIESHWVADEAAVGRDAGRLAPITTDGSMPPLGFRQFQVIDFQGWKGAAGEPFPKLVAALTRLAPPAADAPAPKPAPPKTTGVTQVMDQAVKRPVLIAAVVLGAFAVVGAVSLVNFYGQKQPGAISSSAKAYKSIAVLAFKDQSAARDQAYFAEGVAEALLNRLTRNGDLKVAASTSSFVFKDKPATVPEIAKQLGVEAVLEGSVQSSGSDVRIFVQLVDGGGSIIWSNEFPGSKDSLFALQDQVSEAVVTRLNATHVPATAEADRDPVAVDALYRGESDLNRSGSEGTNRAIDNFNLAIEREPGWALPRTRKAMALAIMGPYVAINAPMIDQELKKARELAPNLPDLHYAEAIYRATLGDQAGSHRAVEALLAVDSRSVHSLQVQMGTLSAEGRLKEAERLIDPLTKLDPVGAVSAQRISMLLSAIGRNEDAIDRCQHALPYNSGSTAIYICLGRSYEALGRAADAAAAYIDGIERVPEDIVPRFPLSTTLAAAGFEKEGLSLIAPIGAPWAEAVTLGMAGKPFDVKAAAASAERFLPVERARVYLLAHDLKAALPFLKRAAVETPDATLMFEAVVGGSYRPHLLVARQAAGDLAGIDTLKAQLRADLALIEGTPTSDTGFAYRISPDDPKVSAWIVMYKAQVMAALGEREQMYAAIDKLLARAPASLPIHDVVFDGYRAEPRFRAVEARHAAAMKVLHKELLDRGIVDRAKRLPPPPVFNGAPGIPAR
jgi:TolB-like protein